MQRPQATFADPAFEPSDKQFAEIGREVARIVRWQKAMTALGIKVLSLNLTPEEEFRRMEAWESEQGLTR